MPALGPYLASRLGPWSDAVAIPSGFGWDPGIPIHQEAPGRFACYLEPRTLAPATVNTLYVDRGRPNNGGNGQSAGAAEQSLWAGLNDVAGTSTIYVLGSTDRANPTIYGYAHAWRFGTVADLKVIVVSDFTTLAPGYAISSTALVPGDGELGTYAITADPGGPHVYEATLAAAPDRVIDATVPDADGVPTRLTLRASIALVEANPGSYYHAGGVLYVRTWDSRAPDVKLRPLKASVTNGHINGGKTVYFERLSFEGGGPARAVYVQDGNAIMVDCAVTHAQALGFEVNTGAGLTGVTRTAHLIRCRFISNGGDGCGYTANGATMTLHGFELDCVYARNSGAGSDQGGSAHRLSANTAIQVVRVNPDCRENKSQGFADVGEGTDGCEVLIVGGSVRNEAVGVYAGNGTKVWLHGVTLLNNTVDLKTDDAAGRIYTSSAIYDAARVQGAGTVQEFTP